MSGVPVTLFSADRKVPPPPPVSFEEFLAWSDEDSRAEWVDGEIVVVATPSARSILVAHAHLQRAIRRNRARTAPHTLWRPGAASTERPA